jgi:hypothetical protein
MNDPKQTLLPREKFTPLMEAASKPGKAGAEARSQLWRTLAWQITLEWDGKTAAFVDKLPAGRRAVYVACEMHGAVDSADMESFIMGGHFFAVRTIDSLRTLGADEYAELFEQMLEKFPNKAFPEFAEDLMPVIKAVPQSYLKKLKPKITKGKEMARPLHDYVYDFVRANEKQFVRG